MIRAYRNSDLDEIVKSDYPFVYKKLGLSPFLSLPISLSVIPVLFLDLMKKLNFLELCKCVVFDIYQRWLL